MKKVLVVIDMQNDFIDGALGTKEAQGIVENVVSKIKGYEGETVFATRDTHKENYLETSEGKHLPVPHCIMGTKGWEIRDEIAKALNRAGAEIIDKPTFGSNALLLKAKMPEAVIKADSSCCAGVTPESHEAALLTMKMCQVEIV